MSRAYGPWLSAVTRGGREAFAGRRSAASKRIDARSVEQVCQPRRHPRNRQLSPCWYGVEGIGDHWLRPKSRRDNFRDYLKRGGWLMVDDFNGTSPYRGSARMGHLVEQKSAVPRPSIEDMPNDETHQLPHHVRKGDLLDSRATVLWTS